MRFLESFAFTNDRFCLKNAFICGMLLSFNPSSERLIVPSSSYPWINLFLAINAFRKDCKLALLESIINAKHLDLNRLSKSFSYFSGISFFMRLNSESYLGLGVEIEFLNDWLCLEVLLHLIVKDSRREDFSSFLSSSNRLILPTCLLNIHYNKLSFKKLPTLSWLRSQT